MAFPSDTAQAIDKLAPKLPETRIIKNEEIEQRLSARLDTIHAFLTNDDASQLKAKLEKASLKDLAIVEGIAYDKLLQLRGTPNVVFGTQEHQQLDKLLPALMAEMKRRGTSIELTERKASVVLANSKEESHAPEPAQLP